MPPIFHNRLGRFLLLAASVAAAACGKASSPTLTPDLPAFSPRIAAPPLVSPVALGSLGVAVDPSAGAVQGTVLLRLFTEAGAKVLYAFAPFEATAAASSLTEYSAATELLPPLTVWAVAEGADGKRGEVRSFTWTLDPSAHEVAPPTTVRRLLGDGTPPLALPLAAAVSTSAAHGLSERLGFAVTVDGDPSEWPAAGRLRVADGVYDVPPARGFLDLTGAAAGEDDNATYVALFLREPPKPSGTTYGFDIGPSQIDGGNFGPGAKLLYRLEIAGGTVRLTLLDTGAVINASSATVAALGTAVELKLAHADAPQLTGLTDLAVRPFAGEASVFDRMQTLFLRSQFDEVSASDGTPWADLRFLNLPGTDAGLASSYLAMGAVLVKDLESVNHLPFYDRGTLPLFFVGKEANGYAGLNTTDRGMLTTLGPGTGTLSRAQLLAHELAHFQNARSSRVTSRWLQEGMSEWSAERLLYKHYPRLAVQRFERSLRFDRYFDALKGEQDQFPLDSWDTAVDSAGYEKSLMFFDLLEQVVGQEALINVFQRGANELVDGASLQRLLERETGKDLSGLFRHWVFAGDVAPEYDPYHLFKDTDGDELLGIDELSLGTDPAAVDSDGDGFTDEEELVRGTDPLGSSLPLGDGRTVLATTATDTSALVRLGGTPKRPMYYGLDPYTKDTTEVFGLPLALHAPVTLAVANDGGVELVTRPLFVNGAEVATAPPAAGILPPVPRKQKTIYDGAVMVAPGDASLPYPAIDDVAGDVPSDVGALDLVSMQAALSSDTLIVELGVSKDVSIFDGYGQFNLSFESLTWTDGTEPLVRKFHTLTLSAGELFWSTVAGGGQETALLTSAGVSWRASGKQLTLTVGKELLADWLAESGERRVCAASAITLEGGTSLRDKGGCVSLTSPGFTRRRATVADSFGLGHHTLDLYFDAAHFTDQRAGEILALEASALREFETLLARPLLDRRQWPLHLTLGDGGGTTAAAAGSFGAYVVIDKAADPFAAEYLVVEQLARLVTADLLERLGDKPFWLQETFIQWLTASALYRLYPSYVVHDFHAGRIEDYRCFVDGDPPARSTSRPTCHLRLGTRRRSARRGRCARC